MKPWSLPVQLMELVFTEELNILEAVIQQTAEELESLT